MTTPPTILVIDDEAPLRRLVRISLEAHAWQVVEAEDGRSGLVAAATERPDVILLDIGLPDLTGFEVLLRLREFTATPVIIISARGDEDAKIKLLDSGADDYMMKPFSTSELCARIRVALRHSTTAATTTVYEADGLRIDLTARDVTAHGRSVALTSTEYQLLLAFVKHAGKTITHTQLLRDVWGPGSINELQYLRVFVNQLRKKLEVDPSTPSLIVTVPGVGYRLTSSH